MIDCLSCDGTERTYHSCTIPSLKQKECYWLNTTSFTLQNGYDCGVLATVALSSSPERQTHMVEVGEAGTAGAREMAQDVSDGTPGGSAWA